MKLGQAARYLPAGYRLGTDQIQCHVHGKKSGRRSRKKGTRDPASHQGGATSRRGSSGRQSVMLWQRGRISGTVIISWRRLSARLAQLRTKPPASLPTSPSLRRFYWNLSRELSDGSGVLTRPAAGVLHQGLHQIHLKLYLISQG